jgi:hypothetical protein
MSSYNLGLLDASGDVRSHDYTNGRGGSSLSEHRLWIRDYTLTDEGSKLVTGGLSPLYYGFVAAIESDTNTRPAEVVEVAMVRNTNTLGVRLTGLQPEVAGVTRAHEDNMTVSADMVNGRCRADNGICEQALNVHYAQTHAISSGSTTLSVDLEVMRLFTGDDESVITVSGLSRHGFEQDTIEIPIVETIMKNPDYNTQEDLDRENYYEFALDFDSEMNLTVTINGWTVVNVIPGIV